MKYKMRSKARHHNVDWPVFRPYTVNLMISARRRLREAKPSFNLPDGPAVYIGDSAISGSGKNFVTEEDRTRGIDTYTRYIRRFSLRSMLHYWEEVLGSGGCLPSCYPDALPYANVDENDYKPTTDVNSSVVGLLNTFSGGGKSSAVTGGGNIARCHVHNELNWEWVKMLVEDDELQKDISMLSLESASKMLFEMLLSIEIEIYKAALQSRSKDNLRGTKVIPNYSKTHLPVEDDEVLVAIYSEYEMIKDRIETLLTMLPNANHNIKQKLHLLVAEELKRSEGS